MTKYYEIEKPSFENHYDYVFIGHLKKSDQNRLIKMISGSEDYLYRITEWNMSPANPKAQFSSSISGDEFLKNPKIDLFNI